MFSEPPLRVGIDARCLNTSQMRGMGKYVLEMIAHVSPAANLGWHFFADRPGTCFQLPRGIAGETELFDIRGYRFHAWEQLALPWRARRAGIQVLHCTATTLPYWQSVPTIVTLHDTLPWQDTGLEPYEKWYLNKLIPAAYARCAGIVTISESSRRDTLSRWPWLERKLHVIPHGVDDRYLNAGSGNLSPHLRNLVGDDPYFLYIGGALERKRFAWAASVFERLNSVNIRLVACGFDEQERDKARGMLEPKLRDRVCFLPFVDENEMPGLYQHAVAVLYPTLYEGFGFPALEAQAVGTPVLMSDLGSLSELKGPAAEVLPVDDLDIWVQTCWRLLSRYSESRSPNEAARSWARKYSWEASAARHLELYIAAAKGRRRIA